MISGFHLTRLVLMAGLVLGAAWAASADAAAAPATQPTGAADATGQADPAVRALIDQLGHPNAQIREAASGKLRAMGKTALPALKQFADADDPEVKARARTLIRQAERRLPPVAPHGGGRFGVGHAASVRQTRDRRIIEVDENGRRIHITQRNDGSIDMTVTGVDPDGKEATETYQAQDAEELKRDNPEAYALYERWQGGGDRLQIIRGLAEMAGGAGEVAADGLLDEVRRQMRRDLERVRVPREQIDGLVEQLRGMDRAADVMLEQQRREIDRLIGPGRAEIDKLREQLLRPRDEQGRLLKPEAEALKGEVQELKRRAVDDFDAMRNELRRALEQDREQIAKLNEELRRQFDDLRDLGLFPQRAGPRPMLGVAVAEEGAGGGRAVTVLRVVPGSRAAKIGVEEGDVLLKVNGKNVEGVRGLLERVAEVLGGEEPEPVVVEVERDGKPLKLEEKPAPTTKPAA